MAFPNKGAGGGLVDKDYGDVTVSESGGVMVVDDDSITYAKVQNVSAGDRLLGRATAGAGDIEEILCSAAGRALLDDANAGEQRNTLGLGSAAIHAHGEYATASQGAKADSALQSADIANVLRTTNIGSSVQAYHAKTARTDLGMAYEMGNSGRVATVGDGSGAIAIAAGTITLDLTKASFFDLGVLTAAIAYTLGAPTGLADGKSFNGWIKATQPASGTPPTLAYHATWDFAGGTAPALSTPANSQDYLDFSSVNSTRARLALGKAWS